MSEPRSFMALDWVKGEIEETLDRAREALEGYADQPDDTTLARQCLTSLHQVNGTLQMVELAGAATLASEMEALAQALMNRSVVDDERAQEALMEGILQLPSHLNRVHRGAEDDPRVHALLIDRMRVARGEEALSKPGELAVDPEAVAEFLDGRGPLEVRKVRAAYQKAMVALLRGQQPPEKMYQFFDKAFARLEQLVPKSPLQLLWAVAGGAMEAGRADGQDPKTVLPLLRGLDQQLKDLVQAAEATLVAQPPAKLFEGLKAIVDASSHESPRLSALRERLAGSAEAAAAEPIGADDDTIAMVATALHEELGSVRDRLDLFVRGSVSDAEGLASLGADLQRVAGTLQVAGLGDLRETIARQSAWLKSQANAADVDEESIMEVASAVLFVDGELMRLAGIESDEADGMPGSLSDAQTAVLKEARASLEAVKQGIVDFIASDWEHSHLEAVPGTLTGVRSVLELVPLERAAALVDQARQYVDEEVLKPLLVPEWQRLDNLADAITSIDYYLERLIEDRVIPDPRLLEIAEESIALLRPGDATSAAVLPADMPEPPPVQEPEIESAPKIDEVPMEADVADPGFASPEDSPSSAAKPSERGFDLASTGFQPAIDRDALEAGDDLDATGVRAPEEMPELEQIEAEAPADSAGAEDFDFDLETPVEAAPPVAEVEEEAPALPEVEEAAEDEEESLIDDEILEIFLEEVVEVLENMDAFLPTWRSKPDDSEALGEIRRAWHTLKGSGRMVGASVIGELSWSVENMLNRVIDGTIAASPAVIDLTESVRGLIPQLREAFAEQRTPDVDVAPWMERADVLASGGSAEDLDDVPLPGAAAAPAGAPADDEPSALSEPVEDDFDLGEEVELTAPEETIEAAPTPSGAPADDEPSELSAPVEDDFDLGEELELSAPEETIEAAPAPSGAPADDEPSALSAPVEGDFDLGDELDFSAPEETLEAAPAPGEDASSALSTPVEDDFDLGEEVELTAPAEAADDSWDDVPSALTEPVEDDFALDAGFEEPAAPPAEPEEPEEPSLFEIFEQEAEEHLVTIRNFVDEARGRSGRAPLSEALRRGLHTLKGSAAMADFATISGLAAPLESLVRAYLDLRKGSDAELSGMVERGLAGIEASLASLRARGTEGGLGDAEQRYLDDARELLARLEAELRGGGGAAKKSPREIFTSGDVDLLLDAAAVLGDWTGAGVTARVEALRSELGDLSGRARDAGQDRIAALADALRDAHARLGPVLPEAARPVLERAHDALLGTLDALAADLDVPAVDAPIAELGQLDAALEPVAPEPVVSEAPAQAETPAAGATTQVSESVAALDLDPEMVDIFFEEAEEILESIEGALDAWPNGDNSAADELMRALHTLKGGARMAGLTGLGEEAHDLETWIGENRATPDGAFFGALRERSDVMAEHVAMLRRGETVVREVPAEEGDAPAAPPPATPEPAGTAPVAPPVEEVQPAPPPPEPEPPAAAPPPPPVPEPAAAPAAAVADEIADDVAETDPEILALFLEEAAELTEMLDGSLQGWRDEPGNEIHMESVLRALHTLKGGARMAGLMALGERVHDLETRITERRSGGEALDSAFLGGIQNEVDALSERIAGLGSEPAPAPAEAAPPAPEPTPAPPAAEPPAPEPAAPEPVAEIPAPTPAAPEPEPVVPEPAAAPAPTTQSRESSKDAPQEMIRVSAGLLDDLVNLAGETSIMRGRVQQQITDFGGSLDELAATIERLRDQVRRLDSEAQEQLLSKQEAAGRAERAGYEDFDPLEMDRYTQLQELTRTLAESASDVSDLRDTLAERLRDTDTLLVQQGRINTELQEGLMRTRMVPFARLLPRLKRIVRQVGRELGKPVDLVVENAEGELDRNVLERMIAPLEHMLRNAVDHGLESPEKRAEAGKPPQGTIRLRLDREGGDILVQVADDGGGINVAGVRAKAVERGLLEADAQVSDAEILSFIMAAGFSTAKSVTQISGRGVGMDVVNSEVKQLGGTISIASKLGEGTTFTVRLPFTVSVNRALMVHVGNDVLAVPLNGVEGIVRVSPSQLISKYESGAGASFSYAGRDYALSYLGEWLGDPRRVSEDVPSIPIIMVRSGDLARAVHVDSISGSREIVVKSLGAQFAGVGGISGATIMGDGSVVVILDLPALLRTSGATLDLHGASEALVTSAEEEEGPTHVMVVDDSVTVRKVTTRLLERKGYRVTVAKDGVEAVAALAEEKPDVMLLDIEMPRMDGFEVATHVRNEAALNDLPIIMITSRTGDKHRERAEAIGVNRFLGKPFQESELLAEIETLTA